MFLQWGERCTLYSRHGLITFYLYVYNILQGKNRNDGLVEWLDIDTQMGFVAHYSPLIGGNGIMDELGKCGSLFSWDKILDISNLKWPTAGLPLEK